MFNSMLCMLVEIYHLFVMVNFLEHSELGIFIFLSL
jgi:hypothetical protein